MVAMSPRVEQDLAGLFGRLRSRSRVVDLSPELHSGMPVWSSHPDAFIIRDARSHARDGYFNQSLVMSEHTGAHVDAPHHFHESMPERTVDAYAPDQLLGPFKLIDLAPLDLQPGELATADQVTGALRRVGTGLAPGDVALISFGWTRHYKPDHPDHSVRTWWADNAPGLDESACKLLADAGIRAVGSDTAACDVAVVNGVMVSDFGHRTYFLPNDIPIIEGLANLAALPPTGVFLALPLRIRGGSGSPLRPIALVETTEEDDA